MKKPIYIPPPRRHNFLLALAEFLSLLFFWASIIACAIVFRAMVGI